MLCGDDQIRISHTQSSVCVWGSWHADQHVWHHTSFVSLNRKKKTRWLHGAYMELPVRFFVALMSHCLQELATVYTKGTVDSVVQLCSNQPLRLFCCIILFIYKNCAAFLNNELPRAFNILIYSDKPRVALQ